MGKFELDEEPEVKDAIAHIKCNKTGEIRKHKTTLDFYEDTGFWLTDWIDGNCSCDCNRYLFFERAAGNCDADPPKCSEKLYSVDIEVDGEIVYRETERK